MPSGKKRKRHKMATHKRKNVFVRTATRRNRPFAEKIQDSIFKIQYCVV